MAGRVGLSICCLALRKDRPLLSGHRARGRTGWTFLTSIPEHGLLSIGSIVFLLVTFLRALSGRPCGLTGWMSRLDLSVECALLSVECALAESTGAVTDPLVLCSMWRLFAPMCSATGVSLEAAFPVAYGRTSVLPTHMVLEPTIRTTELN